MLFEADPEGRVVKAFVLVVRSAALGLVENNIMVWRRAETETGMSVFWLAPRIGWRQEFLVFFII